MGRRLLDEAASYQLRRVAECELGTVLTADDAVAEGTALLGRAMADELLPSCEIANVANLVSRTLYEVLRKDGAQSRLESVVTERYAGQANDPVKGASGIPHLASLGLQQGVMLGAGLAVTALRRDRARVQKPSDAQIAEARRRKLEAGIREQKIRALAGEMEAVEWLAGMGITNCVLSGKDLPVSSETVGDVVTRHLLPHLRDPRTPVAPAEIARRLGDRARKDRSPKPHDQLEEPLHIGDAQDTRAERVADVPPHQSTLNTAVAPADVATLEGKGAPFKVLESPAAL